MDISKKGNYLIFQVKFAVPASQDFFNLVNYFL